jgi:hypothetical protein
VTSSLTVLSSINVPTLSTTTGYFQSLTGSTIVTSSIQSNFLTSQDAQVTSSLTVLSSINVPTLSTTTGYFQSLTGSTITVSSIQSNFLTAQDAQVTSSLTVLSSVNVPTLSTTTGYFTTLATSSLTASTITLQTLNFSTLIGSTASFSTITSEIISVSTLSGQKYTTNEMEIKSTLTIQSSMYVSSFSTLSGTFSTLAGSTITANTMTMNSTMVGSTLSLGTTDSGYRLRLAEDSAYKPGTNTWTTDSDIRLKKDIIFADLTQCYNTVKTIPLRRYTWKDEIAQQNQFRDRTRLGWIAQEVETVFPKAVDTHEYIIHRSEEVLTEQGNVETKYKSTIIPDCRTLNTDQLYATMYGAIQKLIEKQEEMQQEINELRSLLMRS